MSKKQAIVIGAGPGGLTAAYELLKTTDIKPIIFEASDYFGGIARTVNYKGNRIDMGGHRFFSKSDRVMEWWQNILPLQRVPDGSEITYRNKSRSVGGVEGPDPDETDKVMLVRPRQSRIFFLRKFFNYPITIDINTMANLGPWRMFKIGMSYIKSRVSPIKEEKSLEDFLINRFGRELYETFFKDYTEKVWGIACSEISAEWGAQRIKGLSITKAILNALKKVLPKRKTLSQRDTETSLIERFMYPKLGPGQIWEEVASMVKDLGGEIFLEHEVVGINLKDNKVVSVTVLNKKTGKTRKEKADYVFSTMPVKELIEALDPKPPQEVREVAQGLLYRDFITVGLLLDKLKIGGGIIPDTWLYIQEPEVRVGRIQIFNNWSPYLIKDPSKVWIGLEYFVNEGDELWNKEEEEMMIFAINEIAKIGLIRRDDVEDATVIKMKKTYPAYFGTYKDFGLIRDHVDPIENLFLIGRNGMHKYNNQDHSMLTAMVAVENIASGRSDKSNIWAVNTEDDYHEEK